MTGIRMRAAFSATLPVLVLACVPCGVRAATIHLNWDSCTGPLNRDLVGGSRAGVYVTVIGQSEPHKGYQFRCSLADGSGRLPDAWRFDAGGCQPPTSFEINHFTPLPSKACPNFQGALASAQQKSFSLATTDLGLPATTGVVFLRNDYPGGNTLQTNPAVRYFLAAVIFDHAFSVTGETSEAGCGGVERPLCVQLLPAQCSTTALDGTSVPLEIGNGTLTVNGGGCAPVAVARTTWGQIKGSYRH